MKNKLLSMSILFGISRVEEPFSIQTLEISFHLDSVDYKNGNLQEVVRIIKKYRDKRAIRCIYTVTRDYGYFLKMDFINLNFYYPVIKKNVIY